MSRLTLQLLEKTGCNTASQHVPGGRQNSSCSLQKTSVLSQEHISNTSSWLLAAGDKCIIRRAMTMDKHDKFQSTVQCFSYRQTLPQARTIQASQRQQSTLTTENGNILKTHLAQTSRSHFQATASTQSVSFMASQSTWVSKRHFIMGHYYCYYTHLPLLYPLALFQKSHCMFPFP